MTTCYVCGTECRDWGAAYHNVCYACDVAMFKLLGWGMVATPGGNGYYKTDKQQMSFLQQLKDQFQNSGMPTIHPIKTEGKCKQCQRLNDVGVNKCWFCETTRPCDA